MWLAGLPRTEARNLWLSLWTGGTRNTSQPVIFFWSDRGADARSNRPAPTSTMADDHVDLSLPEYAAFRTGIEVLRIALASREH